MRLGAAALVALLALVPSAGAAERADSPEPQRRAVTIWSDGLPLAGDIWHSGTLREGENAPALLMVHGWGGLKSHLNASYAPRFAAAGFVVLTFDYRGWGESPGRLLRLADELVEVREVVDPIAFLEDIRNALALLIGERGVDAKRIGIWGTSLGGGLALQTAAEFPILQALVIQVGSVNPLAGVREAERHPLSARSQMERRSRIARGETHPVPGSESAVRGLRGTVDWLSYARFDPFSHSPDVQAATLIIDAEQEELFDIAQHGAALRAALEGRVPLRYEVLPGRHYDIYQGEALQTAITLQIEWLRQHLGSD
jgi:uncharacterized protein